MLRSLLSFALHQVVMLLNICQSAPGEAPTPPPPSREVDRNWKPTVSPQSAR